MESFLDSLVKKIDVILLFFAGVLLGDFDFKLEETKQDVLKNAISECSNKFIFLDHASIQVNIKGCKNGPSFEQ